MEFNARRTFKSQDGKGVYTEKHECVMLVGFHYVVVIFS